MIPLSTTVPGTTVHDASFRAVSHTDDEDMEVVQCYAPTKPPEVIADQISGVFADRRDRNTLFAPSDATEFTLPVCPACQHESGSRLVYFRLETLSVTTVIKEYILPTAYTLDGKIVETITPTVDQTVRSVQLYDIAGTHYIVERETRETFGVVSLFI